MIADFGIALALRHAGGSRLTETGLSLGTPQYMSPEQATGERELDARSDVYSLACVLYEMLAGEPPHTGPTAQSVVAKLLADRPRRVTDLRENVPQDVADALEVALSKVAADRYDTAGHFAEALQGRSTARRRPLTQRFARRGHKLPTAAALTAAALLLAILAAWRWSQPRSAPDRRAQILPIELRNPPRSQTIWIDGAKLSPDGSRIAYLSAGGRWRLLDLRDGSNRPVSPETQGNNIAFSPAGDSIVHSTSAWLQDLYVVDLATGRATPLTDSSQGRVRWGDDGWVYHPDQLWGIRRIHVATRKKEGVLRPGPGERWIALNPIPLSGGRGMLYTRVPRAPLNPARGEIVALDLRTSGSRTLARGVDADFLEPGYLLVVQPDGTLQAAGFDADRLELTTPLTTILRGLEVRRVKEAGAAISVARDGSLLFVESAPFLDDTMIVAGRDGTLRRTLRSAGGKVPGSLDSRHLARSERGERWLATLSRGNTTPNVYAWTDAEPEPRRLTFGDVLDYFPRFVPRSGDVAFVSPREGRNWDLYRIPFDGSGEPQVILDRPGDIFFPSFTSDGRWVVFCERNDVSGTDVWAHRLLPDSITIAIAASDAHECVPSISPDDRWVAYESEESGRGEIWVRPLASASRNAWQLSANGGSTPRWSADGRELYYLNKDHELVAVPVYRGNSFSFGRPRVLFKIGERSIWTGVVMPSGDEFLLLRAEREAPGRVILVRNFRELVRSKLGG